MTAIAAAGCETPRLDAEVLLAHVLGVARERLLTDRDLRRRRAAPCAPSRTPCAAARCEREPVAYILGRRGFRRLELAVDRRALVPRPGDRAAGRERRWRCRAGARVLDVGTGSGAVALALEARAPRPAS